MKAEQGLVPPLAELVVPQKVTVWGSWLRGELTGDL